jgi:pimeloyl-ACP methyl ester carboxylesterase
MAEVEFFKHDFVASADGVPIAYATRGAGKPALVLIHGWSCDSGYWDAQLQPLSRKFQIITLDLGGHGNSGIGRHGWTIESFGEDVSAVVEAINPEHVVLIGHSMGGNVAISAARRLGDRVKGIVWVDAYRKLGSPRSFDEIKNVVAPFRTNFKDTTDSYVRGMFPPGADPDLVRQVAEDMGRAPPAVAVPALESSLIFGRTITETIAGVEAPIVAINADSPPNDLRSMRRFGVQVLSLPSVGHFPMMEAPERFNELLRQAISTMLLSPK